MLVQDKVLHIMPIYKSFIAPSGENVSAHDGYEIFVYDDVTMQIGSHTAHLRLNEHHFHDFLWKNMNNNNMIFMPLNGAWGLGGFEY